MKNIIKENKFGFIFLIIVLFIFIHISIISSFSVAPKTIFVRVQNPEKMQDISVSCKADISKEELIYDDKPLEKIDSISDYIDIKKWDIDGELSYYLLETGLDDYKGDYEIRIICIGNGGKSVGYTIITNENVPCEIKDKEILVC